MTKFNIAVTSDTVCPWCYVGKKKLEAGIAAYKAANPTSTDSFNVTYHPYQLNPDAPKPGVDKRDFYLQRFGDPERIKSMQQSLANTGEQLGIYFKFGGKIGNTRDSHRLISFAEKRGPEAQKKVVELLFEAYFEKEMDISDPNILQKAGESAGLPAVEVKALLESDQQGPEVDKEIRRAQSNFVTGVPNFVIQGKYEIQGAQDPQGFKRVFEKIKEMEDGE